MRATKRRSACPLPSPLCEPYVHARVLCVGGRAWLLEQDFEQAEGEMVYVPPGWWHAVLNLEQTVALTTLCCTVSSCGVWQQAVRCDAHEATTSLRAIHGVLPLLVGALPLLAQA